MSIIVKPVFDLSECFDNGLIYMDPIVKFVKEEFSPAKIYKCTNPEHCLFYIWKIDNHIGYFGKNVKYGWKNFIPSYQENYFGDLTSLKEAYDHKVIVLNKELKKELESSIRYNIIPGKEGGFFVERKGYSFDTYRFLENNGKIRKLCLGSTYISETDLVEVEKFQKTDSTFNPIYLANYLVRYPGINTDMMFPIFYDTYKEFLKEFSLDIYKNAAKYALRECLIYYIGEGYTHIYLSSCPSISLKTIGLEEKDLQIGMNAYYEKLGFRKYGGIFIANMRETLEIIEHILN